MIKGSLVCMCTHSLGLWNPGEVLVMVSVPKLEGHSRALGVISSMPLDELRKVFLMVKVHA